MSERTDALSPQQWVAIDVAAEALGVSKQTAYRLALTQKWRHDHGWPRGYSLQDIRTTHTQRRSKR
ncbi:hypothetical protein [Agreia sp. COWG]|uniref:hypothetical protein n=1 Tax=Agreia sp. COWG TaxID=2773266 RepID=UPI001926447A|nr:hypothetical protein [Agreia sp. COWG]CAD5999351.1 conserved protein of unknown function [Agreia sp. COWG]